MSSFKIRQYWIVYYGHFCTQVPGDDIGDDDEDSILLDDDLSETTLESYSTPIDKEECGVDEYWVFKTIMQGIYLLSFVVVRTLSCR